MTESETGNPFGGPQLQGAHHQRADMTDTHFDGVNLTRAKFFAVMTDAKFGDTNLQAAVFDDVNLANSRFNNVNLSGASITYANLSGITINGVTLENTAIQDANLTGMTINGILVTDLLEAFEDSKR